MTIHKVIESDRKRKADILRKSAEENDITGMQLGMILAHLAYLMSGKMDDDACVQAFAAHRIEAQKEVAEICLRRAKWHEESFRKELILGNDDKQTHYAARIRECEEIRKEIDRLKDGK